MKTDERAKGKGVVEKKSREINVANVYYIYGLEKEKSCENRKSIPMWALEKSLGLETQVLVQTLLLTNYFALGKLLKPIVFELRCRYPVTLETCKKLPKS